MPVCVTSSEDPNYLGSTTVLNSCGDSSASQLQTSAPKAVEDKVTDLRSPFEHYATGTEVAACSSTNSGSGPSPLSTFSSNGMPPTLVAGCHHITAGDDSLNSGEDSSQDPSQDSFAGQQRRNAHLQEIIDYLECGVLPDDSSRARRIILQESQFAVIDGILYFIDPKQRNRRRAAVPEQLRQQVLRETHSSPYGGHFSGQHLYNALATHWWWEGMFSDARKFATSCPEYAIVMGSGRVNKPPLHPIPMSRPFQILGIDVMDLPLTDQGNRHVVVIQDLFTKWPMAFAVPDQKAARLARLIAEEVIPLFGVPECLLSDRGTNLLSHLMIDLCRMLGITKLNTTAYHPQCDGAVERFNRTLKTMLRKHAAKFGCQWDRFLPGVLWAYRNTPHTSTGEKPSFLLFGLDCRTLTEAAYLPATTEVVPTDVSDYREELMLSLSSARQLAAGCLQRAQARYKRSYDQKTRGTTLRVGDWVLIHFPHDESGRWRKLSRPWHGPYRIVDRTDPDVTCVIPPTRWSHPCASVQGMPLPIRFPRRLLLVWGQTKGTRTPTQMG